MLFVYFVQYVYWWRREHSLNLNAPAIRIKSQYIKQSARTSISSFSHTFYDDEFFCLATSAAVITPLTSSITALSLFPRPWSDLSLSFCITFIRQYASVNRARHPTYQLHGWSFHDWIQYSLTCNRTFIFFYCHKSMYL